MADTNTLNEINKYFAIATFIMPAIVMLTMRRWVTPISGNFFSQDIFRFISYGIFNFAVFQIPAVLLKYDITNILAVENMSKILNLGLYLVYVFILPFILGFILCLFDKNGWLSKISYKFFKTPLDNGILTMWEEIFSQNPGKNIRITLKNGKIIEGLYANGSKASTSVVNKDIYLTRVYKINYGEQSDKTEMWINGNEIETIVFTPVTEQTPCCNCKNIDELNHQIKGIIQILNQIINNKGEEND